MYRFLGKRERWPGTRNPTLAGFDGQPGQGLLIRARFRTGPGRRHFGGDMSDLNHFNDSVLIVPSASA
jgi:hypothetical protein